MEANILPLQPIGLAWLSVVRTEWASQCSLDLGEGEVGMKVETAKAASALSSVVAAFVHSVPSLVLPSLRCRVLVMDHRERWDWEAG